MVGIEPDVRCEGDQLVRHDVRKHDAGIQTLPTDGRIEAVQLTSSTGDVRRLVPESSQPPNGRSERLHAS